MAVRASFGRRVSVLASGTLVSQALLVCSAPLLTRLFTPEEVGVLAVYASLLRLSTVAGALRFDTAIPLAEDDREAGALVVLSVGAVILNTALLGLGVIFANGKLGMVLGAPLLDPYLWILPLGAALIGLHQVVIHWGLRHEALAKIAGARMLQAVLMVAVQTAGHPFGVLALLVGHTAGQALGGVSLLKTLWTSLRRVGVPSLLNIRRTAHHYRRFPTYSTASTLINNAGTQIPALVFSSVFGSVAAGQFALAQRVLSTPVAVLGAATAQVFLSDVALALREQRGAKLVAGVFHTLAQIGMLPSLVIGLYGPHLFAFVFGEEWAEAGSYARLMVPWLYMVFVTSPLIAFCDASGAQRVYTLYNVALFVSRLVALCAGFLLGSLLAAVALFSAASALSWLGLLLWITKRSGNQLRLVPRSMGIALSAGAACVAPFAVAVRGDEIIDLLFASLFSAATAIAWAWAAWPAASART